MLNDIELAILANKLQVPLVLSDILNDDGALTDDVKYGLHEAISDLQPDSALLAIALGALKISNIYRKASSSMDVMGIEASRIINEYGSIWVKNANNQSVSGDEVYETLLHTTEDLEAIAELLDLNCSFLRAKDKDAATLCDILFIQAQSHALIAEEFLNVADKMVANGGASNVATPPPSYTNNVIEFPTAQH